MLLNAIVSEIMCPRTAAYAPISAFTSANLSPPPSLFILFDVRCAFMVIFLVALARKKTVAVSTMLIVSNSPE